MDYEEKQLLLKDLCARLPYGVICNTPKGDGHLCSINQTIFGTEYGINVNPLKRDYFTLKRVDFSDSETWEQIIKPYLRPMSSMTEEEKEYIKNKWCYNDWDINGPSSLWREKIYVEDAEGIIDYFNEHHLDFRGLIFMGLALEAPEGMYKTD